MAGVFIVCVGVAVGGGELVIGVVVLVISIVDIVSFSSAQGWCWMYS
jgi:hypothetical protein